MTEPAESRPEGHAVPERVPDFFIVGHHKSGTTALYEMLSRHPQIFMSPIKEPKFFATDGRPRFQPTKGHVLPRTLPEYLALFADARPDQVVGEASPSYLWSHTAAAEIAKVQPDARIIAILREPAVFLRSLHLQFLRSHVETEKDFRKAMSLERARGEGREIPDRSHVPQMLQYSEHVKFVDQLRRYHDVFPRDRVMVLIYDDFRADNTGTIESILRFLGVDDDFAIEEINIKQTTRTMRSQELDDLLHSVSMGSTPVTRGAKAAVKALTPQRLRHNAFRALRRRGVYRDAPAPDEAFMLELRRRFRPEVAALSEYLDRDLLALWGYDRLT
jgi:hypothetical protein